MTDNQKKAVWQYRSGYISRAEFEDVWRQEQAIVPEWIRMAVVKGWCK